MKKFIKVMKYSLLLLSGFVWGIISTFWMGYSILVATNVMEDPGTSQYEEMESFRLYGVIGIVFYLICLFTLLFVCRKKKISLPAFLLSMLAGILVVILSIFARDT